MPSERPEKTSRKLSVRRATKYVGNMPSERPEKNIEKTQRETRDKISR